MPTFNQLVRNGRQQATYKSTAPALQKGLNTLKNKAHRSAFPPEERRVHRGSVPPPPRSRTPLCVRSPVCV